MKELRKIVHGEVILKEVRSLPENAKKLEAKDFIVVGESETLGNDHRVSVLEDTSFYEVNGTLFFKNESETKIYCPNQVRHTEQVVPESTWKVEISQEYDFLLQEKRNVAD